MLLKSTKPTGAVTTTPKADSMQRGYCISPPLGASKKVRREAQKRCEEELLNEMGDTTSDMVPKSMHQALQHRLQILEAEMQLLKEKVVNNKELTTDTSRSSNPQQPSDSICRCTTQPYEALQQEVQELRSLNKELQKSLLTKIFSTDALELGQHEESLVDQGIDFLGEEGAAQSTVIGSPRDDGKYYAGSGRWVEKESWDLLMKSPTDSMFCRSAAMLYWSADQLHNRSVTGTLSNKCRLQEILDLIVVKNAQLVHFDSEIEAALHDDDLEADLTTAYEYEEKVSYAQTRVRRGPRRQPYPPLLPQVLLHRHRRM
ncbi:hypothetical protein HPB52_008074 [Rhipicephalus sanguineus]|uniref:Uncharacterized protein n=1 Tax=Rhipicephalus sanguineus TaxID=34632 RepID=A0A9D4PEG0_RHISA|nr:hypothetical protein HPB52_008074 [Rhipicephalus sanguineus]